MVFTSLKLTAERLGIRVTERWIFSIKFFGASAFGFNYKKIPSPLREIIDGALQHHPLDSILLFP